MTMMPGRPAHLLMLSLSKHEASTRSSGRTNAKASAGRIRSRSAALRCFNPSGVSSGAFFLRILTSIAATTTSYVLCLFYIYTQRVIGQHATCCVKVSHHGYQQADQRQIRSGRAVARGARGGGLQKRQRCGAAFPLARFHLYGARKWPERDSHRTRPRL